MKRVKGDARSVRACAEVRRDPTEEGGEGEGRRREAREERGGGRLEVDLWEGGGGDA